MTTPFFDLSSLGLSLDSNTLYESWLAQMQAAFPGYNPSVGNLEVIQAQILASFAADLSNLCVQGSDQLFQQFGTDLIGVPFEPGQAAVATLTVTAVDTAGYTLPAGTQVTLTLNGAPLGFSTLTDLTIPFGSSSGTVEVLAASPGTAFNGATDPADLVSSLGLTWVSSLAVAAPASEGLDPEDPSDYLNRLKSQLQLMAPRPITATDYATMALSFIPDTTTDQEEVGRSTAVDGYDPGPQTFVVNLTSGSPTVTVVTPPGASVTAFPGASVSDGVVDVPASTTVLASPAPTTSSFTMSNNASATVSNHSVTVDGSLGNEREVTVAITAADGTALNSDTKTAVQAWFESLREANFIVNVIDPTYNTVFVTVTVHPLTGWNGSDVQSAVQAAIVDFLSPDNWGLPTSDVAGWTNYTVVYTSKLAAVIQNTGGVDYIQDGSLKLGLSSSPSNTLDLTLAGVIALPQTSDADVSVSLV